jgi:hypothetical protein
MTPASAEKVCCSKKRKHTKIQLNTETKNNPTGNIKTKKHKHPPKKDT